jgi:RNA polymerase sigma-70 factor (ECF subfamily)
MAARFDTTQWSLVLAAGSDDSSAARRALAALCEAYWYPLYAFVRRRGYDADRARDLTQGFFASLLARRSFDDLRAERGRFRSFLLAALGHFLANQSAYRRAARRGGGAEPLPLAWDTAEGRYVHEPAQPATPETIFERRWALTVIDAALAEMRREWSARRDERTFERLKACLLGEAPPGGYAAVAADLGTTEGAVKVAVHRLRRRFRDVLRAHIAETVADPADVDDEIRFLIRTLDRG